ncbi:phage integrase [Yersinia enterocolitica]|uniref:phage integrase n=1 Tax=Yersinia enterocolitica TaxID=630 RepID=UPI001C60C48C|nr:tyrosine-type recombinase/integrase [Yersinia enterocolitica]MBW5819575.1 tyrosine-type recombinase/integrase [Yersinia enterocolitica]
MSIKKRDDGRYEVDIYPHGRNGKRIRKRFHKKQEAILFERYVMVHANQKEWLGARKDRRLLSELMEVWWLLCGQTRKNGKAEKRHLEKTITALGNPTVNQIDKRMIALHRSQRLGDGISAATINRDMYRFSGMFSALIKLGEFDEQNPLLGLEPLKEPPPAMTYLTKPEIEILLDELSGDERRVALLCLSTGARWGEGSTLRGEQVNHGKVTLLKTKNGKKRTIPISEEVEREIKTRDTGPLFAVNYRKFCNRLKQIKPDLPRGQATHVLRHTFASWFMMNGGNIIVLQNILGHASIRQTMTYAHLAPDYLADAIKFNPTANINIINKK